MHVIKDYGSLSYKSVLEQLLAYVWQFFLSKNYHSIL